MASKLPRLFLQAILCAAPLACFFFMRGDTAEPCQGFSGAAQGQCEARLAHFTNHAVVEGNLQPYWAIGTAASVKSCVSMVVLGPPSPGAECATNSVVCGFTILAAWKFWGKRGFQAFLLALCLSSAVADATRMCSAFRESVFPLGSIAIITTTSGNLATALAAQALVGVFADKQTWEFLHTDHPDALSVGAAASAEFVAKMLVEKEVKKMGIESGTSMVLRILGPVASAYLFISYCFFGVGVITWCPCIFFPGVILYLWVFIPLMAVLEVPVKGLELTVMHLYRKRHQGAMNYMPIPSDQIDTERKRAILMKLSYYKIPTLSSALESTINEQYNKFAETFRQTGAIDWGPYFLWTVQYVVVLPFMVSLQTKLNVVLDISGFEDFFMKIVVPIFRGGEAWSHMRGAYFEVVLATFWERDTSDYLGHLLSSFTPVMALINQLV